MMIYCKKCGVELEPDMLSCPICGQVVSGKAANGEEAEERRNKSTPSGKENRKSIKQYLIDRIPPFKRIFHT